MSTVHFSRKTRPSALALKEALEEVGYTGKDINYGFGYSSEALNAPTALEMAVNKRVALQTMLDNNVPIPFFYNFQRQQDVEQFEEDVEWPIVGRPDKHSKGRGFWLCHNLEDVQRAVRGTRRKAAATHFLAYINNAREFRVHIMRDGREGIDNKYRSIKISEKVNDNDITRMNHTEGARFVYGELSSDERSKLRKAARQAVQALGLDFGAVDILLKDGQVYVLEVNTAPRLTDETSDTLEQYVNAFMRYWSSNEN